MLNFYSPMSPCYASALFVSSKVDQNSIGSIWQQIGLDTHRWWYSAIIEEVKKALHSGKTLFESATSIELEIQSIAPLDARVGKLWGKFTNLGVDELKNMSLYIDSIEKTVENFGFDLSIIYDQIVEGKKNAKGKGKLVIEKFAIALIFRDIWSETAPSYDIVLKKLLVQWYHVDENNNRREINAKIPFLMILYCYYNDLRKSGLPLSDKQIHLMQSIENQANQWNTRDPLSDLINGLLLNQLDRSKHYLNKSQTETATSYINRLKRGNPKDPQYNIKKAALDCLNLISKGTLPLSAEQISAIHALKDLDLDLNKRVW